jgi:hypothetical protein
MHNDKYMGEKKNIKLPLFASVLVLTDSTRVHFRHAQYNYLELINIDQYNACYVRTDNSKI